MSFYIFFFSLLPLLFQSSHCITILVDGSSEWKNPNVHIGDSIIFKHNKHYSIYILHSQKAFDICNFTHATLLTNPNASKWHPSRPGLFYFSFSNGSLKACQGSQKQAIKVTLAAAAPSPHASAMPSNLSPMAAPSPSSGGEVSSSSLPFSWPFLLHQAASSPGPSPSSPASTSSVTVPTSSAMPLINSNPAVPLPSTGEVDSATTSPLPKSGHQTQVPHLCVSEY
ncbi:hypothetical protein TanjilG_21701 [Lupinus angustifolius]|uniref:Phytocyanin domain-containing protein n=1 Tax=Lupinus angustifolius TaxID=3871 RepID=A0A1J7GEL4_LUPAN|nr:hypothetical protein TanjilG_21701 [Lupinus angustifolius]